MHKYILALLLLTTVAPVGAQTSAPVALPGWVDMHAHPRGDLAYGCELFYGAPYGDIAVAMGNCKPDHSKNLLRSVLAAQTEQRESATWRDGKQGYPDFATWPSWCSILHQQMWVDWIERAHTQGGLNIMVALAVSSHCIASAAKTHGPQDDGQVLLNCIQGIKDLVAHTTFMEIALSPKDVRRIVASGKLAVILGTEMDNIGNFYAPQDRELEEWKEGKTEEWNIGILDEKAGIDSTIPSFHHSSEGSSVGKNGPRFNPNPTNAQIQAELDRLWHLGIRYIFPVHLNNTVFGGTALIVPTLNVANKFVTGAEYVPEQVSTKETGIAFRLQNPAVGLNPVAKMFMPYLLPKNVNPGRKGNYTWWDTLPGYGHRNSLGITESGKFGISYMMKKGFLIDIDHMSEKMANAVLEMAVANDYPVNSGHNGPRGEAGNENGRTLKQYAQLKQIGGMVGMGHGANATDFVKTFHTVAQIMGNTHMAMGTDVGGFSALPRRDTSIRLTYDSTFPRCHTGNRTWDINTDGVAHYGLFADYVRSWDNAGMTGEEKRVFMNSAEDFTEMWEKAERKSKQLVSQ